MLARSQNQSPGALLNSVFPEISHQAEGNHPELCLSLPRLNSYLSADPQRSLGITPQDYQFFCYVVNGQSSYKSSNRVIRKTFVNFFLENLEKEQFDYNGIMRKVEENGNNRGVQENVKHIFGQIRPTIGGEDFSRCFSTAGPSRQSIGTNQINASYFGNTGFGNNNSMMKQTEANNRSLSKMAASFSNNKTLLSGKNIDGVSLRNQPGEYVLPDRTELLPSTHAVQTPIQGRFNAPKGQDDQYQANQTNPNKIQSGMNQNRNSNFNSQFGTPQNRSRLNDMAPEVEEIVMRPPRRIAANGMVLPPPQIREFDTLAKGGAVPPGSSQQDQVSKIATQNQNYFNQGQGQDFEYQTSFAGPSGPRSAYSNNNQPNRFKEGSSNTNPLGNLNQNENDLSVLNESSFMRYEDIDNNSSNINSQRQKQNLNMQNQNIDNNVKNNLNRFAYDF